MPSPLNKTIRLTEEEALTPLPDYAGEAEGLFVGDVLTALEQMPAKSFDLVVADPPYNLGVDFGNNRDRWSKGEYVKWIESWVSKLPGVMSPKGSAYVFCDWRYSGEYQRAMESCGLKIMNRITWRREKGRGAKANWKQNMEDIWFAVADEDAYTFNLDDVKVKKKVIAPYKENGKPKDWQEQDGERFRFTHPSNIWTDFVVPFWSMPENTAHPTQKPEALIERIVIASSNEGDRVLDLFSGSGTTSVIAKKLGRRSLGIEMNPDYVRLGLKRLALLEK
ncbi:MAG TPA: DNA methyltransferase [Candidatus Kapabacteria bacterium]|nr:DNA methyltransferase [Candidatus Kapabacteria bacterium]